MNAIGTKRVQSTLVITINAPKTRNAMTQQMAADIAAAMDDLDRDPALRVGVITGSDGFFCAGQNIADADEGRFARSESRGWWGFAARPPHKPLIAAVDGAALGGGFEIALACDLIVATATARFGLPEVARGMVAVGGGLTRLPRRLPYHLAMTMALSGKPMLATELVPFGLLSAVAQEGPALDAALELAASIAAHPATAVEHTLDIIRNAGANDLGTAILYQENRVSVDDLRHTDDYREGVASFKEKRSPSWSVRADSHAAPRVSV